MGIGRQRGQQYFGYNGYNPNFIPERNCSRRDCFFYMFEIRFFRNKAINKNEWTFDEKESSSFRFREKSVFTKNARVRNFRKGHVCQKSEIQAYQLIPKNFT